MARWPSSTSAARRRDASTMHGELMVTILAGLATFERHLIRARTDEGRKRAQARGVRFGRKPKLTRQIEEALGRREAGEPLTDIGRSYGVAIQRFLGSECGESPWIGGSRGSRPEGVSPRSPLDLLEYSTFWHLLCCSGNRLELSVPIEQATRWWPILVLWSANDRQGTTNGRARHSPTSYVDWAVAMP